MTGELGQLALCFALALSLVMAAGGIIGARPGESNSGALLARAHSHSADPRLIAGYCGKNEELDEAVASFAVAYADRTEADHAVLTAAIRSGRIASEPGV